MDQKQEFIEQISKGYQPQNEVIYLGAAMLDGETFPEAAVKIPLKTMNRHGLIAGATGTGKSKTLQILAENLSRKGVPVLLMDVKGDLSGIAKPSSEEAFIYERHKKLDFPFEPGSSPVEFLSLSTEGGVRLRATVTEFGPVLLSKILDLSSAQSGILSVLFKYCDDNHLPLLDLEDLKTILRYSTEEGKENIEASYGRISAASIGAILRKLVELEQQGGDLFFGERSFDVKDLTTKDENGRGYVSVLRLTDIQDRPKLFSTFMLSLLAEIYNTFPEKGDSEKPELVFFIDEAHLVFKEASGVLMDQIESIIKLIRSKGIGIYFVTQSPADIPAEVLGQLGLKIQHALRAFTAKDRQAIKLAAENYPDSAFYDTKNIITSLGTGEALVTALDEKGRPTPLAATLLRAPMSRMNILSPAELQEISSNSELTKKYNEEIDRESAHEILTEKIKKADAEQARQKAEAERRKIERTASGRRGSTDTAGQKALVKVLTSATFIRGVMGVLNKLVK